MKERNTNESNFVKKVSYDSKSPLSKMRTFAIQNHVPVIGDESLRFLEFLVNVKKPERILEIGTAIGYSAAAMLLNSRANLISIEKDEKMHGIAKENLKDLALLNRAELILGDAGKVLEELAKNPDNSFDFAFIDASKAHYLEHLKLLEPMLMERGIVVFDNIFYLGLLAGRRSINRNKTIKHRMQALMDYCFSSEEYKASLVQVEDGLLLLCKEKGENMPLTLINVAGKEANPVSL